MRAVGWGGVKGVFGCFFSGCEVEEHGRRGEGGGFGLERREIVSRNSGERKRDFVGEEKERGGDEDEMR